MEKYLKHFKIPFIVVGIITIVSLVIYLGNKPSLDYTYNCESTLDTNVVDLAENLTDEQESELDAYIAEVEEEIQCDIVVVTLNQTLDNYSSVESDPSRWVQQYALHFADYYKLGYDKAGGNSIVFVDNLYREPSTGSVYSWIQGSGYAYDKLQENASVLMDDSLEGLTDSSSSEEYFSAYKRTVELVGAYCMGSASASMIKVYHVLILALIVAVVYVLVNLKSKVGDKTTTDTTYVHDGKPNMRVVRDQFTHKTVTKRKIERSEGGGSGGSGGGGGHSR